MKLTPLIQKRVDGYFPSTKVLRKIGKLIVSLIVVEARKELSLQNRKKGDPVGIPYAEAFFKSFHYRVKGGALEISSTWEFLPQLLEGRKPFPMTWLTKEKGVSVVRLYEKTGTVIYRSTPSQQEPWMHPGYKKHMFLQKALIAIKKPMAALMREDLAAYLTRGQQQWI